MQMQKWNINYCTSSCVTPCKLSVFFCEICFAFFTASNENNSYASLLRMLVLSLRCQRCFHPMSVYRLSAWKTINDVITTRLNYYKRVDNFNCLESYNCTTATFHTSCCNSAPLQPRTGDVFRLGMPFNQATDFLGAITSCSGKELALLVEVFTTSFNHLCRVNGDECKGKGLSISKRWGRGWVNI